MGRLAFNISVYSLWLERNKRIFAGRMRTGYGIVKEIENYVIAKSWKWSVKRSYINWLVCKNWGVDEIIMM